MPGISGEPICRYWQMTPMSGGATYEPRVPVGRFPNKIPTSGGALAPRFFLYAPACHLLRLCPALSIVRVRLKIESGGR